MSNSHYEPPKMRRRIRATRVTCVLLIAASAAGFVAVTPLQPAATASGAASSAITVKWTGDASAAAQFQPTRDTASPHFGEFDNIELSVSQTTGLIDQAIRVSVTGFAATRPSGSTDLQVDNAKNFLQAMQCWGEDPLATDFRETCQWGGRYGDGGGLGTSVYFDNALRVSAADMDTAHPTTHDVPFRTADGVTVSGKNIVVAGEVKYPIRDYFSPSTSNEVQSVRIGTQGTGFFDFETQSADTAPQLGCGTAAHRRCWLVVVPRGTVFGGDYELCSGILDPLNNYDPYPAGRTNSVQAGSPLNTNCDYWDNRIVVPLDFAPVGTNCTVGGTELRTIGSQLMIGAMSSWQPALCQALERTFNFSTNPDPVARSQILETGASSASIAYTGFPVSPGELLTDHDREVLAGTKLSYAPVAISSVVIAFLAESTAGRQEQLNVSPRLMAKFLTQSYRFLVPQSQSNPAQNATQLGAVNRSYSYLYQDPEFQALNPTNYQQFTSFPAIALPGPSGADAIRQVWKWIFADVDAVAFMNGTADPWGMTVNPYYLPKGKAEAVVPWYLDSQNNYISTPVQRPVGLTNLDGSAQTLTQQVLDTFPKADETLMPLELNGQRSRFDSIQFAPYSETLLSAARQAFRADPNSKTIWDPNKTNTVGEQGDWVSGGAQLPGQKFMLAITDSVSAQRWGLSTASVELPNSSSLYAPTAANMTAALGGLEATSLDAVKQINPAKVTTGYPMTMVTYAAVNMSKTTAAVRTTIALMLVLVTTVGQIQGTGIGELPPGYVPLTTELMTQAAVSATQIKNFVPPTTNGSYAQDDYESGGNYDFDDGGDLSTQGTDPEVTAGAESLNEDRTLASSTEAISRNALVIALVIGFFGFIVAPFLFRGRGFL